MPRLGSFGSSEKGPSLGSFGNFAQAGRSPPRLGSFGSSEKRRFGSFGKFMQLTCYPAGMEIRRSVCALDCPDACSLLVHIEDGRATRLRGDPAHPVTRGFLCGKVAQYLEREYSPERLLYPQKRTGAKGEGRFERITWDDALDTIAARLGKASKDFGPESIL